MPKVARRRFQIARFREQARACGVTQAVHPLGRHAGPVAEPPHAPPGARVRPVGQDVAIRRTRHGAEGLRECGGGWVKSAAQLPVTLLSRTGRMSFPISGSSVMWSFVIDTSLTM